MNYWYIQQHSDSQNNYAELKKPDKKGYVWHDLRPSVDVTEEVKLINSDRNDSCGYLAAIWQ